MGLKILYVTDYRQIAQDSGGYISDYLNDLLYYGLYELQQDRNLVSEVVDSTPIISLYKENKDRINHRRLWGGFSSFWLIEDHVPDRSNIEEKIKDKYFDLIIYGSVWRCLDYYDIVSSHYSPDKIIMIDGHDKTNLHTTHDKHPYFKREMVHDFKNLKPISFALPESKFSESNKNKVQDYGTVIPGNSSTYIFTDEESYYEDYNRSYYGVTMKKAGWDTMRHYEIIGSYCMPYFIDIMTCPSNILTTLPKDLIREGTELARDFNEEKYYTLMDELFVYAKENLTTKALAKHVLNNI